MKTRREAIRLTSLAALAALVAACQNRQSGDAPTLPPGNEDGGY